MIIGVPRFKSERTFNQSQDSHLSQSFRSRYVALLTGCVLLSSSIFFLFAFYFAQQNQVFFKDLAFSAFPSMVKHIEREGTWTIFSLGLSLLSIFFSTFWISRRMISHLIEPISNMEKHMRQLVRGDWAQSSFGFSESKDFKELCWTYDYLVQTLKSMTEHELEMLQKMRIDPNDKATLYLWTELIHQKKKRLGISSTDVPFEDSVAKPGQRRAS